MRMVVVEEQPQQPQTASTNDENAANCVNNQLSSKDAQNVLKNSVEKVMTATEVNEIEGNQAPVTLNIDATKVLHQKHCSEDTLPVDVDVSEREKKAGQVPKRYASSMEPEAVKSVGEVQSDGYAASVKEMPGRCSTESAHDNVIVEMEANRTEIDVETEHDEEAISHPELQMAVDATIVANVNMDIEMNTKATVQPGDRVGCNEKETDFVNVKKNVMEETGIVDVECVKTLSSPILSHLSADEAMELIGAHQVEDLLPDVSTLVGESTDNNEYQWFDEDENDEEGEAVEIEHSLFETTTGTSNDVFGFDGIGVTEATSRFEDNSDGSGDTLVIATKSNSSSSTGSSSTSSSSSGSSCDSGSSSSEEEVARLASKKRRSSESSNIRKIMSHQKKRVQSETEKPSQRRPMKRKRRIPQPVIPPEFAVFESESLDPILRGTYAVRNNRRASFVGSWGFCEDDFQETEKISPFEYISRARVSSRRKIDKRPVSGKYGGFFKLRQFNGSLVKVREEQVELQFVPMPTSDGEEEDEGIEVDSDDESDEVVASRYVVLGRGKNRFGRFLIRGYLNPEIGRLTVKRRYLE